MQGLYESLFIILGKERQEEIANVMRLVVKEYQDEFGEEWNQNQVPVTLDRPSVMNGAYDFSKLSEHILTHKEQFITDVTKICGESGENICKIVFAEMYYQRNDCYRALLQIVGAIPILEQCQDESNLFAALYNQMCIMIVTGQVNAVYPMIDSMKKWIEQSKSPVLKANYDALAAWCAMYDDDWDLIENWMCNSAPNEFNQIRLIDLFPLFVKIRIYLLQEKYMAAISLIEGIRPMLLEQKRIMDLCELDVLYALASFATGHKEEAFLAMDRVFESSCKYRYDRLIADEGESMYILLKEYVLVRKMNEKKEKIKKEKINKKEIEKNGNNGGKLQSADDGIDQSTYVKMILDLSKQMALLYPRYLHSHKLDYPALTKTELEVLRLMADGRSNSEIAEFLSVTINTIKFHSKNIFKKLGAKNRKQAVEIGREERYL